MEYQNDLQKKFATINKEGDQSRKPAVSCSLTHFLTRQSERLKNLYQKKKEHESKLSKISADSLSYRSALKESIDLSQKKHQRNRSEFLKKRSKHENYRITQIEKKRSELLQRRKEAGRKNQQVHRSNKEDTVKFWDKKKEMTISLYQRQTSAPALYETALIRKRNIENSSILKGEKAKDENYSRHDKIRQKIGYFVRQNQEHLDDHNQQIRLNLIRNQKIMKEKEGRFINTICTSQDRSKNLRKTQNLAWEKKLKGKKIDDFDLVTKTKQKFYDNMKRKSESMKNCHCLQKVKMIESAMKTSSVFYPKTKQLNNQEQEDMNATKFSFKAYRTMNNFSVLAQRKSFMESSSLMKKSVLENKRRLRQIQEAQDEKKIMIERQISEALRTRQKLMNESNNFVRKTRIEA